MSDVASGKLAWLKSLLPLLLLVAGVHLALRVGLDAPSLAGDEAHYMRKAREDAEGGQTSLLPGRIAFDHRLRFAPRVYANLRVDGDFGKTFRNIEALQVFLAVLCTALAWTQARLLGLRPAAAALAGGLVGLFPWQAFHAHSLWPETLHGFFFALAFTAVLAHLRSGARGWLLPAGLALGFALLTKATLQAFAPILVVFLALGAARSRPRSPDDPAGARLLRACSAGGLFLAGLLLVVGPQVARNARDGLGIRLSANRWWNLELGLTPLPEVSSERVEQALQTGMLEEGEVRWLPLQKSTIAYMEAADDPVERERLARERTLAHVRERGLFGLVLDQVPKLAAVLLHGETCFDQAVTFLQRWGDPTPAWLSILRVPGRVLWWALLGLAAVGLARNRCRSQGWCLSALLLAYMLGTLFLIPMKLRFFLPAFPVLVLFVAEVFDAWRGRRSPPSVSPPASR